MASGKDIKSYFKPDGGSRANESVASSSSSRKRKQPDDPEPEKPLTVKRLTPATGDARPFEGDTEVGAGSVALAAWNRAEGVAGWLNRLNDVEALQLHRIINAGSVRSSRLSPGDLQTVHLQTCTNSVNSERTGRWWIDWQTCELSRLHSQNGDHPRVMVDINARSLTGTAAQFQAVLRAEAWLAFKQLTTGRQVKLLVHHVAYNSARAAGRPLIPLDTGRGSSISHLCDVGGCVRIDHLEVAPRHIENMIRQRCRGVILVIQNGQIIAEKLCEHAVSRVITTESDIGSSCRRLELVFVDRPDLMT